MRNLEQKAVDLLDTLENLTTQYAPDVVAATMQAVQITSLGYLVFGGALTAIGAGSITSAYRSLQKSGNTDWSDSEMLRFFAGGVCACLGLPPLLYLWNWVGVFAPKLALAHKVLGL
jgi:hypothetical protein